jgi:hypothetical protein
MLSSPAVKRPLDAEVTRARRRRDRLAAQLAAEDAALEALLKAQRELLEAVVDYQHRSLDLHTDVDPSSINYMNTETSQTKRIGRPILSKHPFIERITKMGLTVKAAAEKLGVPPATMRSWYATGDDARNIPDDTAAKLSRAPWNIPASAWRRRK